MAVTDAAGHEIVRHGASGFLGEMNLLSGQTVFLTAVVTEPMRYIAVDREELRGLLFEDGSLSDLLLSAFVERRELLQQRQGIGIEIVGPRDSERDAPPARVRPAHAAALHLARPGRERGGRGAARDARRRGAAARAAPRRRRSCAGRATASSRARSGSGSSSRRARRSTCSSSAAARRASARPSTAPRRASTRWSSRAPRSAARRAPRGGSRTTSASRPGSAASELTSRAVTQARKFSARTATPYRARALEPGADRHLVRLEDGNEVAARAVLLATGAEYRRLPVEDLDDYEGLSVFYAAGPPEAQLCGAQRVGVVGGGNSAAQAAVWLARGGALVTLLHRRADLARDDVRAT